MVHEQALDDALDTPAEEASEPTQGLPEAPTEESEPVIAKPVSARQAGDRWHAVVDGEVLSAHSKSALKAKLRDTPNAPLACIIRGKQVALKTSVSF